MEDNINTKIGPHGFTSVEINRLKQILYVLKKNELTKEWEDSRLFFYDHVRKFDKRNKTNMVKVFPELKEYYKELAKKYFLVYKK